MNRINMINLFTLMLLCGCTVRASPNVDPYVQHLRNTHGGFLPSPVRYFNVNGDQVAMESEIHTVTDKSTATVAEAEDKSSLSLQQQNANSDRSQEPRIGIPLGTTLTGYSSGAPGVYSPLKLDVGGLIVGTIIGLAFVFLIPKLITLFSAPFYGNPGGSYGRNVDSIAASVSDMISRVDDALLEHDINSTACIERALCTSVQPGQTSDTSLMHTIVDTATKNSLVRFLMDGSRLQQVLEMGRRGQSCAAAFPQCPFTQNSVTSGIKSLITDNNNDI